VARIPRKGGALLPPGCLGLAEELAKSEAALSSPHAGLAGFLPLSVLELVQMCLRALVVNPGQKLYMILYFPVYHPNTPESQ
jgi:hypothetical protein